MSWLSGAMLGAHIILGTVAVAAGALALASRKGGTTHIGVGRIFAVSMGLASAFGAILGLVNIESLYITFHAGILGVTLIASSLLTVRAQSSPLGAMSVAVGVVNFFNAAALIFAGFYALPLPDSSLFGFHAADYFFLAGMASIVVIGDIRLIFLKTLTNRRRIARHLWRMCLGFFIAAGSAFTGPGAAVFPEAIQNSGVLAAPELIIISLMLYWLARTLVGRHPATPNDSA